MLYCYNRLFSAIEKDPFGAGLTPDFSRGSIWSERYGLLNLRFQFVSAFVDSVTGLNKELRATRLKALHERIQHLNEVLEATPD